MEASGAQAKAVPVTVTVQGLTRETQVHVVASGDRVEFTAPGVPARVNIERAALLLALGVTSADLPAA